MKNSDPHIVLLEDQAIVREVLAEVSSELSPDCKIYCASSLAEARKLFERVACDCMVADLQLGDGESLELLGELRAQGKQFPVILISGFLTPEYLREAKKLGVTDTLSKPFRPADLLQKLRHCTSIGVDEAATKSAPKTKATVVPFPNTSPTQRMLPELFELDRQLTLLDRLLTVHSSEANVAEICVSAARIAIDITRSNYGFVSLLDGGTRLLLAGHASQEECSPFERGEASCAIEDTPFGELFAPQTGNVPLISGNARICWPGVMARQFFAMPITLQNKPVGVLCVIDPQADVALTPMQTRMLGHLIREMDTMLDNRASHAALSASVKDSLIAMARILEARDRYTKDHSARVSSIAVQLARNLGLDDDMIQLVRTGGLLHDLGKVGVPDSILLKPGSYNEEEYAAMKAHPGMGDQLLKPIDMLVEERRIVRSHHERWDGRGYPDGLAGEEIPLPARIVGIADAIDAMTTHRVYRQAQPLSFCLEQLRNGSGTQFDPVIAQAAIEAIEAGQIKTLAAHERPTEKMLRPQAAY